MLEKTPKIQAFTEKNRRDKEMVCRPMRYTIHPREIRGSI
jgi:hypothetical protein